MDTIGKKVHDRLIVILDGDDAEVLYGVAPSRGRGLKLGKKNARWRLADITILL